jgi:hypothetical protein
METTPNWIKERNAAHDALATQGAERQRKSAEEELRVAKAASEVWQRLIRALRLNVEALSRLKGEQLSREVSTLGPAGAEVTCRVIVQRQSFPPILSEVFHYYSGETSIRCVTHNDQEELLELRSFEDGSDVGISIRPGKVISAEEYAESLIREMVEEVP